VGFIPNPSPEWKIFETESFTFKYPPDYTVSTNQDQIFYRITPNNSRSPFDTLIIDTSLKNELSDYEQAATFTKYNLVNIQTLDISNGVIISGKNSSDFNPGITEEIALLKYKDGAIGIYNSYYPGLFTLFPRESKIFYLIATTFKFSD
jgi:hypothetical protein